MADDPPIKLNPTNLEEIRAREEPPAAAKTALEGVVPAPSVAAETKAPIEPAERLAQLENSLSQVGANTANIQGLLAQLHDLSVKLESLMAGMQGTVGYRAHQTFVCRKCQQRGNVAAKLNCTSCGEENLWGWWPAQQ